MMIGSRELMPGSSIFVAGDTLCRFRAGERGLRMLKFRPVADRSFITREEYLQGKARSQGNAADACT